MLPRKRTRGSISPSLVEVNTERKTALFGVTGVCPTNSYFTKIPNTLRQTFVINAVGARFEASFDLKSDLFTWEQSPVNGRFWPSLKEGSKAEVQRLLYEALTSSTFAVQLWGAPKLQERVMGFNYDEMNDVIGSGFPTRRADEFIVNPCSKVTNLFASNASAVVPSNDAYTVTDISMSDLSITCKVKVDRLGNIPFTVAAFDKFRSIWLPERDPKSFAFLYSKACQSITAADFEVLTAIGELKETVGFLYEKCRAVANILRMVRRRDWSFVKNWHNLSKADLWLEARYAIRPLFYDIQGIIKILRGEGKLKQTLAKYSSSSDENTDTRIFSFNADGFEYTVQGLHTYNYRARGGAYARLAMDLEYAYKFGTLNLASSAWELIPYSFIIDWFFSVSSFVASLNPNPIYSIDNGFVSVTSEDFFTGTIIGTDGNTTQSFGFSDAVQRYHRIPYDSRLTIAIDVNLNFHKFVDLYLIFGRR